MIGNKIRTSAAFSGVTLLIAGLYTTLFASTGMHVTAEVATRVTWLNANGRVWPVSIWLWMLALFAWMVLLTSLAWSYLPGFRVASMLQSGLMVIAAVLIIVGLASWMAVLPHVAALDEVNDLLSVVDTFVMGMLGAGLFMAGAVTAWVCYDLVQEESLSYVWTGPGIAAGLLAVPTPFVLPYYWLLVAAAILWIGWCGFLYLRSDMPSAFAEMK